MRSFKYLDITVRGAQLELEGSFPTWRTQLHKKKKKSGAPGYISLTSSVELMIHFF